MDDSKTPSDGVNRRRFLTVSATGAALPVMAGALGARADVPPQGADAKVPLMPMRLRVNGQTHDLAIDPRTTLLDALRDHIGLTGSKKGCDHGQCGACTVHVDGRSVNSCLLLAASIQGREVTTIEGLSPVDGDLHPIQQAFLDHDAFQCGYCTPGQIMSAVACIKSGHAGSDAEIREFMSGNLCRCAAYPNIVAAVADAKTKMGG